MADKPLPLITADSRHYWEGCAEHQLRYQYCGRCEKAQFPPASHCRSCFGSGLQWRRSAGEGAVHSFTHVHRAPTPAFQAETPYTLALIDLDEGFRMMACLRGAGRENAKIGDRVHIIFETLSDDIELPQAQLDNPSAD